MSKIPTISLTVEDEKNGTDQSRRHSHQPTSGLNPLAKVRRTNSIEKSGLISGVELRDKRDKKRSVQGSNLKKPTEPDIPEVEQSEDEGTTTKLPRPPSDSSLRVSFTKNTRKTSSTSKSSRISADRGFINDAYDHSNGSSLHGSVASLSVIKEQYCCCKKWTRLEKILLAICATLAVVIVALIIALGVMGKSTDSEKRSMVLHF